MTRAQEGEPMEQAEKLRRSIGQRYHWKDHRAQEVKPMEQASQMLGPLCIFNLCILYQ